MTAKISMRDLARVVDFLDELNDPRRTEYGNIRHKLVDIIVIAFTAANIIYRAGILERRSS
jgi:hypothetical protein